MGTQYDQFVFDNLVEIYWHHEARKSGPEIVRLMSRHPTTIWLELKQNSLPKGGYKPASERIFLPLMIGTDPAVAYAGGAAGGEIMSSHSRGSRANLLNLAPLRRVFFCSAHAEPSRPLEKIKPCSG